MTWDQVLVEAEKYVKPLRQHANGDKCNRYLHEIEGLAEGAGVSMLDILALNVRTEIMFGLFTEEKMTNGKPVVQNNNIPSDGCTSIGWLDSSSSSSASSLSSGQSFLAQNWDWQKAQEPNLVICHISQHTSNDEVVPQPPPPNISMVTEAGIIGKIGLNDQGVGCCLNAIRARGVDPTKLPVHFALRTVLESRSRKEAIAELERLGVAGSAHILVADQTGSTGLECSPISGIKKIEMDAEGRVYHTNHLVLQHPGVDEPAWLPDSHTRLARIKMLAEQESKTADVKQRLLEMLKDVEGWPCSISRKEVGESTFQTLFTIVMDLSRRRAVVKFGNSETLVAIDRFAR